MNPKARTRAIAMISGGLDSALAARIIKDLDVEVYGLHFILPWNCGIQPRALDIAHQINIPLKIIQLGEGFLKMLRKPCHGTGVAMNPCVDCRIYNLLEARTYMHKLNADFVFTGEILGQRPMSQMRQSLSLIERRSNLQDRLLRPLCAQLLEPTIPEQEGKIDRAKLYDFSGRSRSKLQSMAQKFKIQNYSPPGGGCLLTDKNFSNRLKDSFCYGYKNMQDIIALKWGRHFRLSKEHKAIVGRNDQENQHLLRHANPEDLVFILADEKPGPTVILKGKRPQPQMIKTAAYLTKHFSKFQNNTPSVCCFSAQNPKTMKIINSDLTDKQPMQFCKI